MKSTTIKCFCQSVFGFLFRYVYLIMSVLHRKILRYQIFVLTRRTFVVKYKDRPVKKRGAFMTNKNKLFTAAAVMLVACIICVFALGALSSQKLPGASAGDSENSLIESSEVGVVDGSLSLESDESFAEAESEDSDDLSSSIPTFTLDIPEGTIIYSPNTLVYCLTDDAVVYENIIYEKCAPASLTKMLTALVALKYLSNDYILTVGEEIDLIGEGSSRAWLQKGKRYKMSSMLDALFLPSGNDAAYTLAVNTARAKANDPSLSISEAVSDFVRLMNDEAKNLGCTFSNFSTPDGYDAEGQYTTTEDMLKISIAAYNNPYIKEAASKSESGSWSSTNMLLREDSEYYNPCVNGLKTGSTDDAGMCVAVSAIINNKTYIMLFMKGTSSNGRFADANTIISLLEQQTA